MTSPKPTTASSPAPNRAAAISQPPNAVNVAITTSGLSDGAAVIKVTAALGGTPEFIIRRASGTDEHSQVGTTIPITAATIMAGIGLLGSTFFQRCGVIDTATVADAIEPSSTKGSACTHNAAKEVNATCSRGDLVLSHNAALSKTTGNCHDNTAAASTTANTLMPLRHFEVVR